MVPYATSFEMEKQFQVIYTISKFKEVQQELTEKLYWDIISKNNNDYFWTTYDVWEFIYHEHRKKKSFYVSFQMKQC